MCVHSVGKILSALSDSEADESTENNSQFASRGLAKWMQSSHRKRQKKRGRKEENESMTEGKK